MLVLLLTWRVRAPLGKAVLSACQVKISLSTMMTTPASDGTASQL
jgi:hypothetical protein